MDSSTLTLISGIALLVVIGLVALCARKRARRDDDRGNGSCC